MVTLSSYTISKILVQYEPFSQQGAFKSNFIHVTFVCLWYPITMLHLNLINTPPPIARPYYLVNIFQEFLKK